MLFVLGHGSVCHTCLTLREMSKAAPQPTPAQRRVLDCIAALEAERRPVSTMMLAEQLEVSRQTVRKHLLKLAEQGLVVYEAQERQQAWVRLSS